MPAQLDRFAIPSQCSWFTDPANYGPTGVREGYCCNPDPAATVNNCASSAYILQSECTFGARAGTRLAWWLHPCTPLLALTSRLPAWSVRPFPHDCSCVQPARA